MKQDIMTVQKGDVIRFKAYALRVNQEPIRKSCSVTVTGRLSIDGCPIVTKHFMKGVRAIIEKP